MPYLPRQSCWHTPAQASTNIPAKAPAAIVHPSHDFFRSREHKHLENGVAAVLVAMQPMKHLSKFPQYFRGPHSLVYPVLNAPATPKAQMLTPEVSHAILQSLQQTKVLFASSPAFADVVQNLWFVIYNLSSGVPRLSARQQYQIHDSLRSLKVIGVEVLADFGRATPPELLLMAFQELITLVVEELRPDTSWAYSILAHADVIVRIHRIMGERLALGGAAPASPEIFAGIMEVPFRIAVTYQEYGKIALE